MQSFNLAKSTCFPDNKIEAKIMKAGTTVCGIDEVGRGAWAGPLVLAAVVPGIGTIDGVRDSKKISPKKRDELSSKISLWASAIGIGVVGNDEIDRIGLSEALTLGAQRAIGQIEESGPIVDHILLDGNFDFVKIPKKIVETYTRGDDLSHAIAAASIVAKVFRDDLMSSELIAGKYPPFFFESNKGYPSPVHKAALRDNGPTPFHRISWNIFETSFSNPLEEALI